MLINNYNSLSKNNIKISFNWIILIEILIKKMINNTMT